MRLEVRHSLCADCNQCRIAVNCPPKAFYRSPVADNSSFEQWESEGASDAAQRAAKMWRQSLAEYEQPPLEGSIEEELDEWVARQKASFPDSDV
jgi:trimethylamine--corrinoid protein Co-methyltransferase